MNFGQATPPAIFAPILGTFGLALAWRKAAEVAGAPGWIGETLLGAITALYAVALAAYLAKLIRRPGVFRDDLAAVPGRSGLAAACISAMVLAAGLARYAPGPAQLMLVAGLAGQVVVAGAILARLWRAPLAVRRMTPVWQLTFVGFIVAPVAAVPLGWVGLAEVIMILTLPMALTIWAGHGLMLWRAMPPPPLRPLLAIHLGPASLLGLTAAALGYDTLAFVMAFWSLAIAFLLLARSGWLTEAGFSPFWGALTFPSAAFTNLMLTIGAGDEPFGAIGLIALGGSSLLIPMILIRITRAWLNGSLAVKSAAARA